ncbi:beta-lactamase [Psychrobacillus insolitus]|uniref:Beta-lactamase n=1 Tax=Psychrobacillus insolitus TaxID=1461 RepID=A0A2W7N5X7_9BACI|nr:serine hydrolase [Psychrobacillus insolitus]PZX07353.1 beta-lactamase [Psychrobacillus insolitus]
MLKLKGKRKTKNTIVVIVVLLLVAAGIIIGLSLYGKDMMKKIPGLSFDDALNYTLKDNRDAVITVGIVKDGQSSYIVYGNNAGILSPELHTYEIGSLTKTFTAAMVAKVVQDDKINV